MSTKMKTTMQLFKNKHINSSYHSLPESDSVEVDPSYKRSTDILPNGI